MKVTPSNRLVWFAVLGGGLAWATQHVINVMMTYFTCNQSAPRLSPPLHVIELASSILALVIQLGALVASAVLFQQGRRVDAVVAQERHGEGAPPPIGRVTFLAMIGLTVNPLVLAITVMTAIGAPLLSICQQA